MRTASGYEGELIVDPEHRLASKLRSEGLLDVAITSRNGYSHGMAQPAVLVVTNEKKPLFQWACVPSIVSAIAVSVQIVMWLLTGLKMNIGGAKDRPMLEQIWENVEAQMENRPAVHKKVQTQGAMNVLSGKIMVGVVK